MKCFPGVYTGGVKKTHVALEPQAADLGLDLLNRTESPDRRVCASSLLNRKKICIYAADLTHHSSEEQRLKRSPHSYAGEAVMVSLRKPVNICTVEGFMW